MWIEITIKHVCQLKRMQIQITILSYMFCSSNKKNDIYILKLSNESDISQKDMFLKSTTSEKSFQQWDNKTKLRA